MKQEIFSLEEINIYAKRITRKIRANNYSVIFLKGEMGAGKTTLIREILKCFDVKDNISSPTFSIVNEYKIDNKNIYHFDCYRIGNESDLINLGLEEYFDEDSICFFEWPEKILSFLPAPDYEIGLSHSKDINHRNIKY